MLIELLMGAPMVSVNIPTSFTATTINSTRIDLSWVNAGPTVTTEIWRNGVLYVTAGAGVTTLQDIGIAASQEYAYRIRHKSGNDYSVFTVTHTRSGSPPAPTLLSADNNFEDDVALTWSFNGSSHTAVRVYRDGANISGDLSAATTSYTDLALPNGTYSYTVRTYNGVVESINSNAIVETVSFVSPLTAPSGFTATATHADSITLSWTNGDATAQMEVYRGTSPTPTTLVATRAAGNTSYTDGELAQGTHYYYRIRHVKLGQLSSYVSDDDTTPTTAFTAVNMTADDTTEEITLTWALSQGPAMPTYEVGSWSDTLGEQTASAAAGVTAPHVVVSYASGREIVPTNTGEGAIGTLTYLRVKNSAGVVFATLTNLTCDFDLGTL